MSKGDGVSSRSGGAPLAESAVSPPVGVDEVGRGALFGPVITAAVVLEAESIPRLQVAGLTDSKKLAPRQRDRLDVLIRQEAIAWSLGFASVAEIDRWNILQASLIAMARAVHKIRVPSPLAESGVPPSRQNLCLPRLCLVDGNQRIPDLGLDQRCVVGGDRLEPCIAAASIVAKVWRDRLIERLAAAYDPRYDLSSNKGYGTAKHRAALTTLGPTPQHRRSFAPCQSQPANQSAQLQLALNGIVSRD